MSFYDNAEIVAKTINESGHRNTVGGLWGEIGTLQFDFLIKMGLTPSSRLIDVGCGCLRGGVHFVSYLDAGLYFGVDANQSLLDVGRNIEILSLGLADKLPKENLLCTAIFDFSSIHARFDYAIAQSLFTHMQSNSIRLCLKRLASRMAAGGKFYATFFLVPSDHPYGNPADQRSGIVSFDAQDPYHYRFEDIVALADGLPWQVSLIGDWNHPRGQSMVEFRYVSRETEPMAPEAVRLKDFDSAGQLAPGDDHYRAYVGPPDRFDFMSATQFALLFALGLRDHNQVLDFGCGSLRLGRLLIPFLRPQGYYGIDPNAWLIDDALDRELGRSIMQVKRPSFSTNDDFKCNVFGEGVRFDFVVAQSIITHCGRGLTEGLVREVSKVLKETGKFVFSIIEDPEPNGSPDADGWVYPGCVAFGSQSIKEICRAGDLVCRRLPWFHPGAVWYIAARRETSLPNPTEMPLLRGAVLFDKQFSASLTS